MTTPQTPQAPVLIPFVCPICAGANGAHLISLSRAGGMDCAACGKWLRSNDVVRALHAPRDARTVADGPMRTRPVVQEAFVPSADPTSQKAGPRVLQSRRDRIVWPPTAATRAVAAAGARRS